MNTNIKIIIMFVLLALLAAPILVLAEGNAPTSRQSGFLWYGKYMDAQENQLVNLSNLSFHPITNTAARANATVLFNVTAGTNVVFNSSVNVSTETYSFRNNSSGAFIVNITESQNMSFSCSQFVTEVNANSTLVSASSCSGNETTLTAINYGTGANSYALSTNETNLTLSGSTFSSGANYTVRYLDAGGDSSDANAGSEDLVIRSRNDTGILTERARIVGNVSSGSFRFSDLVVPVLASTPPGAVNGSVFWNTTTNTLDCYYGSIRYCGNGTVK